MIRILFIACLISLKICWAKPADPVLLLKEQHSSLAVPLLQREIARQAVAQVFRDDLGYLCRDCALGAPEETQADITLQFEYSQPAKNQLLIRLSGGPENCETWQATLETENYAKLLKAASTAAAALAVPRQPSGRSSALPEQSAADTPRLTDLIELLRLTHAVHMRNPSAASYALLIRAYANLGQRCAHTWSTSSKVYQARSLIYAQRFLRENPNSANALYLRAYALGLCGLHQPALNDLESGKALQRKEPPSWVQPLESMLKFDTDALIETANSEHPQHATAALMAMITQEYSPFNSRVFETYDRLNTKPDENLRMLVLLNEVGGVRAMHETTIEGLEQMKIMLRGELLNHDILPASASAITASFINQNPSVFSALFSAPLDPSAAQELKAIPLLQQELNKQTARGNDTGEPSLAALGNHILDYMFTAAVWRQHFMDDMWSVSIDSFTREVLPVLTGHPYLHLLEANVAKSQDAEDEYARYLRQTEIRDLPSGAHLFFTHYLDSKAQYGPLTGSEIKSIYLRQLDETHTDLQRRLALTDNREQKVEIAERLLQVSPHSSYGGRALLEYSTDWETEVPAYAADNRPEISQAVAERYRMSGQLKKAIPYYRKALLKLDDIDINENLAECLLKTGRTEQWLEIMQHALTLPDHGLYHTATRCKIVKQLMKTGKTEQAVPYAEAASCSGAQWALAVAAECAYAAGNQERCEELLNQEYARYKKTTTPLQHYTKCLKYNISTNAAWFQPIAEQATAELAKKEHKKRADTIASAYYHWSDKRYDQAIDCYQKAYRWPANIQYGMLLALVQRDKGNLQSYKKTLATVIKKYSSAQKRSASGDQMLNLAILMQQFDESGGDTDRLFSEFVALETQSSLYEAVHCFLAGKYMELIGEEEKAVRLYYRGIAPYQERSWTSTYPYRELMRRGLDPYARYSPDFQL